jgi:hypothetical protein
MLYAGEAVGELHTGNGPLTDDDLVNREVVGEELPGQPPREYAEQRDPETAGELPEELPKGIVQRLEDLQRRLGRCEGRLELAQVVENTLRKQLKRESERADRADRLEEKLREAEADLRIVEDALYRARRGRFKRFFGIGAME